jgi:hypothetical protein
MRRAPGTGGAAPRLARGAQPRGGTRPGGDARSSAPGAGLASPRVPASPRTRPRARLSSACRRVGALPRGDPRRFHPASPSSPVLRAETKSYLVERADVLRAGVGLEVLQDHLLDHQALLGPGIARCGRHGGAARGSGAATGSTRSAICPSAPRARTPRSAHLLGVPKKSSVPRKTVINSGIAVSTTVSFLFRECSYNMPIRLVKWLG